MKWTTESINIDIDTGEIITKHNRDTNYIIIKKEKKTHYNETNTRGVVKLTNICKRKYVQLRFNFDKEY